MTVTIIVAVGITLAVLGIGGAATSVGPWYQALKKPSWNPPNWAFAPAWTIILGLAAWSGVLGWTHAVDGFEHTLVAVFFGLNIILHLAWSPLFFNLQRPDWALMEVPFLWLSIVILMIGLHPISPLASLLLTPYLLWVSFAAFLNFTIVRLNAPFAARTGRAPQT